MEEEQKKRGTNWIGILIVLLLMAGPQILPPIARFVTQVTGGYINLRAVGMLPLLLGAIAVIAILGGILKAVVGALQTSSERPFSRPSSPSGLSSQSSLSNLTSTYSDPASTPWASSSPASPSPYERPAPPSSTHALLQEMQARQAVRKREESWQAYSTQWDWDDEEPLLGESRLPQSSGSSWQGKLSLPAPPRFEPLISGKVLAFSILGALLVGGALFLGTTLSMIVP